MAKKGLSYWKKKTWKVFSEYIRRFYASRDGYAKCVTCGKIAQWKELQAGHFVAGRTNSILFAENNVHPQCYSCNVCNHGEQLEYFYFMKEKYGMEVIEELRRKRHEVRKYTVGDYEVLYDHYKDALVGLDIRDGRG